jgi:hypothetical protein
MPSTPESRANSWTFSISLSRRDNKEQSLHEVARKTHQSNWSAASSNKRDRVEQR